jgi:hypothetical protein
MGILPFALRRAKLDTRSRFLQAREFPESIRETRQILKSADLWLARTQTDLFLYTLVKGRGDWKNMRIEETLLIEIVNMTELGTTIGGAQLISTPPIEQKVDNWLVCYDQTDGRYSTYEIWGVAEPSISDLGGDKLFMQWAY